MRSSFSSCPQHETFDELAALAVVGELSAMEQVIAIMFVIVVIGLLADKILFSPMERFLHRRWGTNS